MKPYPMLWFDTEAEEAVHHYTSIFPNSKIGRVLRYGHAGPGPAGSIMTIDFELDGQPFVALNGGPDFRFNESVSFVIECESQEEVDRYWDHLVDGGEPEPCGWLKDRFGLAWQVVPRELLEMQADPDPVKAGRAMEAILKVFGKFDIAALRAAYEGEPSAV